MEGDSDKWQFEHPRSSNSARPVDDAAASLWENSRGGIGSRGNPGPSQSTPIAIGPGVRGCRRTNSCRPASSRTAASPTGISPTRSEPGAAKNLYIPLRRIDNFPDHSIPAFAERGVKPSPLSRNRRGADRPISLPALVVSRPGDSAPKCGNHGTHAPNAASRHRCIKPNGTALRDGIRILCGSRAESPETIESRNDSSVLVTKSMHSLLSGGSIGH